MLLGWYNSEAKHRPPSSDLLKSVIKLCKLAQLDRFLWIISMSKFLTSISEVTLAVPDVERALYYSFFWPLWWIWWSLMNDIIPHNSIISLPFCSLGLLGHWWHQAWAGWDWHQKYFHKDNIPPWSNKSTNAMLTNKRCVLTRWPLAVLGWAILKIAAYPQFLVAPPLQWFRWFLFWCLFVFDGTQKGSK